MTAAPCDFCGNVLDGDPVACTHAYERFATGEDLPRVRRGHEQHLALRQGIARRRGAPLDPPPPLDDPDVLAVTSLQAPDDPCPDCNCPPGSPHHDTCDREECARCGRQRLSCPCGAGEVHA